MNDRWIPVYKVCARTAYKWERISPQSDGAIQICILFNGWIATVDKNNDSVISRKRSVQRIYLSEVWSCR